MEKKKQITLTQTARYSYTSLFVQPFLLETLNQWSKG
jgi:hypothetical protein